MPFENSKKIPVVPFALHFWRTVDAIVKENQWPRSEAAQVIIDSSVTMTLERGGELEIKAIEICDAINNRLGKEPRPYIVGVNRGDVERCAGLFCK